ncbi:DUF1205 domain-containing protein [Streptomyces calidiresistens]
MRLMFTRVPAPVHIHPLVPLARTLRSTGHGVRVVSNPQPADAISVTGPTAVPPGEEIDLGAPAATVENHTPSDRIVEGVGMGPDEEGARVAPGPYRLALFAHHFPHPDSPTPSHEKPMVDELVEFAREWEPDLVLWDPVFFASPIAARAVGAAHGRFLWGRDSTGWARQRYRRRMEQSASTGDGAGSEDAMAKTMLPTLQHFGQNFTEEPLTGQWSANPLPEALHHPVNPRNVPMRWVPFNGTTPEPSRLRRRPTRPRVCLSPGVSRREFLEGKGDEVLKLRAAFADPDAEIVATLNHDQLPPGSEVPDNVRLVDHLPLNQLLPSCSAIIRHGGDGTMPAAMFNRVPQLVAPRDIGDDDQKCRHPVARDAGPVIPPAEMTAQALRDGVTPLPEEPRYREGADALYADMLTAPEPSGAVPLPEKLTAECRSRPAGNHRTSRPGPSNPAEARLPDTTPDPIRDSTGGHDD